MHMTCRCIAGLGAVAFAVMGLSACGGGGSSEFVARIAGVGSISKASLEHWVPVEAVVLYQEQPKKPVPNGVIPDPPEYTACISFLESAAQKPAVKAPKLTAVQLKRKCRQKYAELKELTLNTLIDWYWTIGAGTALGIRASDAEVKQRFLEFTRSLFRTHAELTNYLRFTGQTTSDLVFRSRVQVFSTKLYLRLAALQKQLPKGLTPQQRRSVAAKFIEHLPPGKFWAAKTTCREGYVVSACKEYRGSLAPGLPN
jgi:hypothetical protein